MSLKILVDGLEIPYKKETLQIKETNNAFGTSIKISHNEFPFLIIKTPEVLTKLNLDRLQNVNAKTIVACDVIQGKTYYKGKLIVSDVFTSTIKADIIYESDLLELFSANIRDFMPVIDVNGDPSPEPYSETSESVLDDSGWAAYASLNKELFFPNREWCFPVYSYRDYYEAKQEFKNRNRVNDANEGTPYNLVLNTLYVDDEFTVIPRNNNMLFPKVFLLTPLKRCLDSLGYKLDGDFIDSFSRRLFFFSEVNQGVEIPNVFDTTDVDWSAITPELNNNSTKYLREYQFVIPAAATYRIKWKTTLAITDITKFPRISQLGAGIFEEEFPNTGGGIAFDLQANDGYDEIANVMEAFYEFEADDSKVGQTITFTLTTDVDYPFPESLEFNINLKKNNQSYYQFHPTFDTSRYVPDWTVAKLLNEISMLFNTDFQIDEIKKTFSIIKNQNKLLDGETLDLSDLKFNMDPFTKPTILGVLLKYANAIDEQVRTVKDGVQNGLEENYIEKYESGFKYLPVTTRISAFNDDLKGKDGEGLAIFNFTENKQLAIESFNDQSLRLDGPTGINQNYWVNWTRFRLNGSEVVFTGPVTDTIVNDLKRTKNFYVNQQKFVAKEYTVKEQYNSILIELTAISVNF